MSAPVVHLDFKRALDEAMPAEVAPDRDPRPEAAPAHSDQFSASITEAAAVARLAFTLRALAA